MQNSVVVVLGTGGTIAGTGTPDDDSGAYRAAQLTVEELLAAVPGLPPGLLCEQVSQIDSKDMGPAVWHRLIDRLRHHLASPHVAGVVVTHGTDTLEETAYFLQRVLAPAKPVVLTAAMRPATAAVPDGPGNLRSAVAVAFDDKAHGVLVAMAGQVFAARDVRKAHVSSLDAFAGGDAGALATVGPQGVAWHRQPPQDTPWVGELALPEGWPRVDLVVSHAGADGAVVPLLVRLGARGLVAVGTGNGTLHESLAHALQAAADAGVTVWRSSRCAAGTVITHPDDTFAGADDLTPWKARIELQLRLMERRA